MNEADQEVTFSSNKLSQLQPEELHIQEQLRLAALIRDISLALIQSTTLAEMIQHCAEALVTYFDAAFARIWTLNEETQILELQASAGLYTHLNGSHSRIPMGTFKIGLIASERLPHLTNKVLSDPHVSDHQWARDEGMVAFAGYPLLVADRMIGVMGLFARQPLSPSILDAMASVANTIAIGIDRKQGELERERLLHLEREAHIEAEAALSVRSNFLSSVSHDLRTPLATIKANFQLVQRRMKNGRPLDMDWLNERLESIERATTKMTGMVEDLLDIGRLQTQQRPDDAFRLFDLLLLVRQAITEQQAASKRHQLILKTSVAQLPINGNAPRLDRVLTNLLGNAVKYSPEGGEIIVEVTQEDEAWAYISIQDQGVGIPAADLPHIFEPFHRASNVVDSIQGTGVGLASAAQVIEQHHGTISVTSKELQGSCFTIQLPLASEVVTPSLVERSK